MKDFDLWNNDKKLIEFKDISKIVCKKRQIWLCKIGENVGNELSKSNEFIRPILILNSFLGGDLILILPLTTKYSISYENFLFKLDKKIGLKFDSYVALNQIKVISKKRLLNKIINDIGVIKYREIIDKFNEYIKL